MKIESVKAEYELTVTDNLSVSVSVDNTVEAGEERLYSFLPDSDNYRLLAKLTVKDKDTLDEWEWERWIDLKPSLKYGFLDELMENMVHQWAKGMSSDPDGMIGSYRVDDPAVVWLTRKSSYDKVVRGKTIRNLVSYSAEIVGTSDSGTILKAVCEKYGLRAQRIATYANGNLMKELLLDANEAGSFSNVIGLIEKASEGL